MVKKRVNLDLDSDLWKQAKLAAVQADSQLREWVTDAIKEKLTRDEQQRVTSKAPTGK